MNCPACNAELGAVCAETCERRKNAEQAYTEAIREVSLLMNLPQLNVTNAYEAFLRVARPTPLQNAVWLRVNQEAHEIAERNGLCDHYFKRYACVFCPKPPPLASPTNISKAVAWAREQHALGKRHMLIVYRNVDLPSPASKHPDEVAFRSAVGANVAECCYGLTPRLIGYMREDIEAAFCCAGEHIDVARHVSRLVPTWTE